MRHRALHLLAFRRLSGARDALLVGGAAVLQNCFGLAFVIVASRTLGPSAYSDLAVLISAFLVLSIIGNGLQAATARWVTTWSHVTATTHRPLRGRRTTLTALGLAGGLACALLVLYGVGLLLRGHIASVIGAHSLSAAALLLPTVAGWGALGVIRGIAQGVSRYALLAATIACEGLIRVLLALLLLSKGFAVFGAYGAGVLSFSLLSITLLIVLRNEVAALVAYFLELSKHAAHKAWLAHVAQPPNRGATHGQSLQLSQRELSTSARGVLVPTLVLGFIFAAQELHIIVVKHLASAQQAGAYAAAAVAAKSLMWLAQGLAQYVLPATTRRELAGASATPPLLQALLLQLAATALVLVVFVLFGDTVLRVAFGSAFVEHGPPLVTLTAAMGALGVAALLANYYLARRREWHLAPLAVTPALAVLIGAMVADHPGTYALALLLLDTLLAAVLLAPAIASSLARAVRRLKARETTRCSLESPAPHGQAQDGSATLQDLH